MGSGAYRVVVEPAHSAAPLEKGMGWVVFVRQLC